MTTRPTGASVRPAKLMAPPEELHQLDFLLGHNECVGRERPDGSPRTVIHMHGRPTLGGYYHDVDISWPGTTAGRWTFGWNPVDREFLVHYIADSGSHGTATSPGWQDGELTITGYYVMAEHGTHRYIRDVFREIDGDHYVIHSYVRSAPEEEWRTIDVFDCLRARLST